jgi:hypothetical protein
MLDSKQNKSIHDEVGDDPHDKRKKRKMNRLQRTFQNWPGKMDFLKAQGQVAIVLVVAAIGNMWPVAYQRNENHNPTAFWVMNAVLVAAALFTLKHDKEGSARGVQLLSRPQTEEWKGWMQWMFIMVSRY